MSKIIFIISMLLCCPLFAAQDAYDSAIESFNNGDYAASKRFFQWNVEHYKKTGKNAQSMAASYGWLGQSYYYLQEYKNAQNAFDEAISYVKKTDDKVYLKTLELFRVNNISAMASLSEDRDSLKQAIKDYLNMVSWYEENNRQTLVQIYNQIAINYYVLEKTSNVLYPETLKYYEKGFALAKEFKHAYYLLKYAQEMASIYTLVNKSAKAMNMINDMLDVMRKIKQSDYDPQFIYALSLKQNLHYMLVQYRKAIEVIEEKIDIYQKAKDDTKLIETIIEKAMMLDHDSDFTTAHECYLKAIDIAEKSEDKSNLVAAYRSLAGFFNNMNRLKEAKEFHDKAFKLAQEYSSEELVAVILVEKCVMWIAEKKYEKAIENLTLLVKFFKRKNNTAALSQAYQLLASMGVYSGINADWTKYFELSLEYPKQFSLYQQLAGIYSSWASFCAYNEDFKSMIKYAELAYENASLSKNNDVIITAITNLASMYLGNIVRGDDAARMSGLAEEKLLVAVDILEKVIDSVPDYVKKDYFSKLYDVYQNLILSYVARGDLVNALSTLEASRARDFKQQLGLKLFGRFDNFNEFLSHLLYSKELKLYLNIWYYIDYLFVLALDSKGDFVPKTVSFEPLLSEFYESYGHVLDYYQKISDDSVSANAWMQDDDLTKYIKLGGYTWKGGAHTYIETDGFSSGRAAKFNLIIRMYRHLICYIGNDQEVIQTREFFGRTLYNYILDGVVDKKDYKRLVTTPSSALALLPFETLLDKDGKYLVENYDIEYTNSFSMLDVSMNRKYDLKQKPLAAFGGAIYDKKNYTMPASNKFNSLQQIGLSLQGRAASSIELRNAYQMLGVESLQNLPATLEEVNVISKLTKSKDVYVGEAASEAKVKKIFKPGNRNYFSAIHFAAHGYVVSEYPELSSIVLSLGNKDGEDGFLTVDEIKTLDMRSDIVFLSACDTALGKFYKGEGIDGLMQAFFLAGANSICVSMWPIADDATKDFMVGVYEKVVKKDMSYSQAINEMKRDFIMGKTGIIRGSRALLIKSKEKEDVDYSSPYFWSPYVYYGN